MRVICYHIFQRQHQQITKRVILLFKHSTARYHLNILIIIAIIYNIYIECEVYTFAYRNNPGWIHEQWFLISTMVKWKYRDYFTIYFIYQCI